MQRNLITRIFWAAAAALAAITLEAPSASAAGYITVHGGPTYTPGVGGFKDPQRVGGVNDAGTAVGVAIKYNESGVHLGQRAIRWDGSGTPAIELGNLGTDTSGYTESSVEAINDVGTSVGSVRKWDDSGAYQGAGHSAARWHASGTAVTELGSLGTDSRGFPDSGAVAINDAGTAVGFSLKYSGLGAYQGTTAVRWDASGTTAIELESLGTSTGGYMHSSAHGVNNAGTTVGWAYKYDSFGAELGGRAVRWDAGGTAVTELGNLDTYNGMTYTFAEAMNNAGTAVGWAYNPGPRAVRWDASVTAATELGNLGTGGGGAGANSAVDINDAGTAVGYANKYDDFGWSLGQRAVRWDAGGTTATELGNLGTDISGYTLSLASAINNAGITVGWAIKYDGADTNLGMRAVYWGPNSLAVDVNTLIDPASGWLMNEEVQSISDTGWIAGAGLFDPDGPGGQAAYRRMYVMQLPATAVPEPATVVLFGVGLVGLSTVLRRRVRRNVVHHLMCENRATRILCAATAALAVVTLTAHSTSAAYVDVYGPTYTPGVGGFQNGSVTGVNDAGTVVGNADKYNGTDVNKGSRAVRWDGSGSPATELENLGTNASGVTNSYAFAINNAGTAVGSADKYDGSGAKLGRASVRWDGSGAAPTELGRAPFPYGSAAAINDTGTSVGYSYFNGFSSSAVRWDATGTATVLELEEIEIGASILLGTDAVAINNGDTAVGSAYYFFLNDFPHEFFTRAVRWERSGTAVTVLGSLTGFGSAAVAINDAGTAVGYADSRAVRWDASGTAATTLDNLGTRTDGGTSSSAIRINEPGTAIGYADKYDDTGVLLGRRAVRWDASSTAATELGNLGTNGEITESDVFAINDAGIAVGYAHDYDGTGTNLGERAVYWGLDAVAVDLNTLLDPASGWTLNRATAISNTGWIGGSGSFDPDGPGGQEAYARLFLMQVPGPNDLPGDFNQNGTVDAVDYVVWRKGVGVASTQDNYNLWRTHFGKTTGSGSALPSAASLSAAVPEPATVALFGIGMLGIAVVSRGSVRRNVVHHLMRENRATRIVCAATAALAVVTLTAHSASAAPITIYGGPTYTPGVGGFQGGSITGVNDAGTVVGNAGKYNNAGVELGSRAVRWDGSGAPAMELENLGTNVGGVTQSSVAAINSAGLAVGWAVRYDAGVSKGPRAVRWDNSSTAATELRNLGTDPSGVTNNTAGAINDAGTAVGTAWKYDAMGAFMYSTVVRWDGFGTVATELQSFGFNGVWAINNGGTAVGVFDFEIFDLGAVAVRWDGSGTGATFLEHLGNLSSWLTYSYALAINDVGTAVGYTLKMDQGAPLGYRAVRWDATGTAATELGNIGTSSNGITTSLAIQINDAGTAVGYADKYDDTGESLGRRAVRWDAFGTAATELGNLGANDRITETDVFAINDAGIAVGYADDYDDSGANLGERAVYWGLDGLAVDLNTLIDPVSGWTLNRATAISNTGWIGGSGVFDPDGPGGQDAYGRMFLMHVPELGVLPGDFNFDGAVDAVDYVVWRNGLGTTYTQNDYDVWRAHFGQTQNAGSGATAGDSAFAVANLPSGAVPEPASLMLLLIAAINPRVLARRARVAKKIVAEFGGALC